MSQRQAPNDNHRTLATPGQTSLLETIMNNDDSGFTYEFGPFRLDPSERRLLCNGHHVALSPKVFNVLIALVRKSGQLVTKEEMLNEVWPDSFVEEGNLTVSISVLRKALGKNNRGSDYIETVMRRGYRFVNQPQKLLRGQEGKREPLRANGKGSDAVPMPNRKKGISLAVLPLKIVSADRDMEYLSYGIAESLIDKLFRLPQLRIVAYSAVLRYRGREIDPQQVGRELGVPWLMLGRIFRLDERLIIRMEMLEALGGWQIWGEQYSHSISNILAVQEEVSQQISERLRIKLIGQQKQLLWGMDGASTQSRRRPGD
jgi:DNA-binding winged helix-turn-helix (wHTH) protein